MYRCWFDRFEFVKLSEDSDFYNACTHRKDKMYRRITQGKRWMSTFRSIRRRSASGVLLVVPSLWLIIVIPETSPVLENSMVISSERWGCSSYITASMLPSSPLNARKLRYNFDVFSGVPNNDPIPADKKSDSSTSHLRQGIINWDEVQEKPDEFRLRQSYLRVAFEAFHRTSERGLLIALPRRESAPQRSSFYFLQSRDCQRYGYTYVMFTRTRMNSSNVTAVTPQ